MTAQALPLLAIALLVSGCAAGVGGPTTTGGPAPPAYAFGPAATPTDAPDGFGSEPSLHAAADGALYFTSVLGSATARGDGVWKSTDGGRDWTYLGKADYPFGGGDSDLDELQGGRLLLTGQWRPAAPPAAPIVGSPYVTGGESVSFSDDGGRTWTNNPVAGYLPAADRQWLATHGASTAWLAFNQAASGLVVGKSTDGGRTWLPPVPVEGTGTVGPNGIPSDIVAAPDGTLYVPYGPGPGGGTVQRVYRSTDGGATFTEHVVHRTPGGASSGAIFSSLALDTAGGLWLAWAETQAKGMRVFLSHSTDRADSWSEPVQVVPDTVTAAFPWVVAGAPGRVAVAYYAANGSFMPDGAPANATWHPVVSFSHDAASAQPTWAHVQVTPVPNHVGPICTGGTGCEPQFRRLGDFFETALLADGRVAIVWADDAVEPRVNRVAVQAAGPGLL